MKKKETQPLLKSKNDLNSVFSIHQEGLQKIKLDHAMKEYKSLFNEDQDKVNRRQKFYTKMVNNFYHLVTDFYEYGWGESFHFACRHEKESFDQSIARSEHYVGLRLGLKPGMRVLDVGCGVGGPAREIARFTGAHIEGINIVKYQIERGISHNLKFGMSKLCSFIHGDYMNIPVSDNEYDSAYSIEATCHAPCKLSLFKEIYRVLKPGALFCSYEWCMTDEYDPKNKLHNQLKKRIEIGNALPDIPHTSFSISCLKKAGFEVLDSIDFGKTTPLNPVPWYACLDSSFSVQGFRFTRIGRWLTGVLVRVLEFCRIAPAGSAAASDLLLDASKALVEAGKLGIFTPSFFIIGRKPK